MGLGAPEDEAFWDRSNSELGAFSVYTKPVEKSEQDDRDYRLIQLDNKLQALLVSDRKADKAAASLDVAVGHLHDPDDMPGLAHFCEHLLFMGTEQFPKENEYSEYLNRNSGHSNAFTATTNTNYYFSVAPNALSGALARFAGFFHSPLFSPSCTIRELNAVDSENKKNQQNDLWRIYQVNKHLSKPGHVWCKFGSGNKESLTRVGRELKEKSRSESQSLRASVLSSGSLASTPISSRAASPAPSVSSVNSESEADGGVVGRETRRRLVEWWSKEYCASRMRLTVIGKDSLDDLAALVVQNFSRIPNRGRDALPIVPDNPFGTAEKGTLVSVQTVMAFHCMEISFPLDWQPPLWRYKPASFLADIIGHEGPGSLHSYLKDKGWITSLLSGQQALARGFAMFRVTLYMTADGFFHYRDIMEAVFGYISLLKSQALPVWYQHEASALSTIRFRFQEQRRPEDYAVWLSETMSSPYPRNLILTAPQVMDPWGADGKGLAEAARLLDSLRITESRTVLMGQKEEHVKVAGQQEWQTEPWYGTQFRVDAYDPAFVKVAQEVNTALSFKLPEPNEFIPENLSVSRRAVTEPQPRPHLIRKTPLSTLWYKKDDRFWIPKTHFILDIRSPVANSTPKASVLNKLYTDLVTDSLTEYSYAAELAGLAYNFVPSTLGVILVINGYNDKLSVLLQHVVDRIRHLQVSPDRLEVYKEQAKLEWENFFLGQTYRISDYYGRYLLNERQWTIKEKLEVLPSVTPDDVKTYMNDVLAQVHIDALMVGNSREEEAAAMIRVVEEQLGAAVLPAPHPVDSSLLLPEGSNFVWTTPVPNPNEPNSSLTYYLRYGSHTDQRNRVISSLLTQIISEPAFNILRTQEQLGYIVSASTWIFAGAEESGLRIVVQSERTPIYLENRVEAFLDHMKNVLEDMSEVIFAEQKSGLLQKWQEAPKNLSEETSRYWNHIDSGYLDFLRRHNDSKLLETITRDDVRAHFMSKVHPSSSTRAKLSVHCPAQKPRPGHISIAAAEAFEQEVKTSGVEVDSTSWREELLSEGEPTVTDFAKFWQGALTGIPPATAGKLLSTMQALTQKFPAEKDAVGSSGSDVKSIDDVLAFKRSLQVSERPYPLVEWKDLPTSHL